MADKPLKRYIFASDFDQTLPFNDSGYGLTIAASESADVSQISKRTVLSTSALAVRAPILEEIAGWQHARIRKFFEANGMLIQEWQRVGTDWLTLRPAIDLQEPAEFAMLGPERANS